MWGSDHDAFEQALGSAYAGLPGYASWGFTWLDTLAGYLRQFGGLNQVIMKSKTKYQQQQQRKSKMKMTMTMILPGSIYFPSCSLFSFNLLPLLLLLNLFLISSVFSSFLSFLLTLLFFFFFFCFVFVFAHRSTAGPL